MSNSNWAPEDSGTAKATLGAGLLFIIGGPPGSERSRFAEIFRTYCERSLGLDAVTMIDVSYDSASSAEIARARAEHDIVIITQDVGPTPNPLELIEKAAAWREVCAEIEKAASSVGIDTEPDESDDRKEKALRVIAFLVLIDMEQATPKQRREMQISLADHTSPLGRQLTEARLKYRPHVGAKQLAKMAARADGSNVQSEPRHE